MNVDEMSPEDRLNRIVQLHLQAILFCARLPCPKTGFYTQVAKPHLCNYCHFNHGLCRQTGISLRRHEKYIQYKPPIKYCPLPDTATLDETINDSKEFTTVDSMLDYAVKYDPHHIEISNIKVSSQTFKHQILGWNECRCVFTFIVDGLEYEHPLTLGFCDFGESVADNPLFNDLMDKE